MPELPTPQALIPDVPSVFFKMFLKAKFRMFMAAFMSLSNVIPHSGHMNVLLSNGIFCWCPHLLHIWLLGSNRPILAHVFRFSMLYKASFAEKHSSLDLTLFCPTVSSFHSDSSFQSKSSQIDFLWLNCLTTYEENHFSSLKSADESLLFLSAVSLCSCFLFAFYLTSFVLELTSRASSWNILENLLFFYLTKSENALDQNQIQDCWIQKSHYLELAVSILHLYELWNSQNTV